MSILNIIDRRTRSYRFKKVNVVFEPTRHDNRCYDADQAMGMDFDMGYHEMNGVELREAIGWATVHSDELTMFIYDDGKGF